MNDRRECGEQYFRQSDEQGQRLAGRPGLASGQSRKMAVSEGEKRWREFQSGG